MNHKLRTLISILALASVALGGLLPATAQPPTNAAVPTPSSSLLFIENAGQFAEGARFQVLGTSQGTVWLANDAIWLTTVEPAAEAPARSPFTQESGEPDVGGVPHHGVAIKLTFVDSNPQPRLEPFNRLETHVSYFLGSDPAGWHADVPVWGGVRYVNLYPGIDLELAGEASGMVPRLVARPGADLGAVRLRVEGVDGVTVENGMLRLKSAAGEVSWPLLQVEGAAGGALVQPRGAGVFEVVSPLEPAATDAVTAPADDPSDLLYSTFLGGNSLEGAGGIVVDSSGAVYVTGCTDSSEFPTTPGAFDTSYNGGEFMMDALVVKLNADGSALSYATFLGGSGSDLGLDIALAGSGAAYITGATDSVDFPTTPGAFDTSLNGTYGDTFVVKLSATGSALDYATFLGGSSYDDGQAISIDSSGAAYVLGYTSSSDFPTTPGAFNTSINDEEIGAGDAFVVKLNAAGLDLEYSTFLGGSEADEPKNVAVDSSGAAFVIGHTYSSDFPITPGAFDTSYNGGDTDIFVSKLNATGSTLDYSTFLGGSSYDSGKAISIDSSGAAYVTGYTISYNFPTTPGAFDTSYNGGEWITDDGIVVKLNATGSALSYATFLGGSLEDWVYDIVVDGAGNAFITGGTRSSDFPTTPVAFDISFNDDDVWGDAFLVQLNATGSALDYSTFLGGSESDSGGNIAVGGSDVVYIQGATWSTDFPTTAGAYDTSHNGQVDIFLVKLSVAPPLTSTYLPLVVNIP